MRFTAIFAAALFTLSAAAQQYTNPVLFADYSDPDVIRVGDDYWMTASSFTCFPGLQILHSRDLVNWEIVNAALPLLKPTSEFDNPSHGNGVWAPCIRFHDGKYWIFWGDPDYGIYQIHTDDPFGKWSEPHLILAGKGLIDTSPLWDDDGRVYLVHAWAGSRAGFKSVLGVCELDAGCTRVIGSQSIVFDGKKNGNDTVEGPKFYKRDGWYYIFAPAGGVKEGWQLVLRSRSPYGPYEYRTVLHQGCSDIHGPHQGGWVTDVAGDSWFLHFEDRYAWGRVCHLQPVTWLDDGWCIIGVDRDGDGIGEPVSTFRSPSHAGSDSTDGAVKAEESRTGFLGKEIPLNWQWEANPKSEWYMTNPAEGCLRLNCVKNPDGWKNLRDTPNILAEKLVGPEMTFEAKFVFRPSYEGDRAGVVITGLDYSTLEMHCTDGRVLLERRECLKADKGTEESVTAVLEKEIEGSVQGDCTFYTVWIKVEVYGDCECKFSYSLNGRKYKTLGEPFKATAGRWIGAKLGLFATAETMKNDGGSVEIH